MDKLTVQRFPKGGIGRSLLLSVSILLLPLLMLLAQILWAKKSEIDSLRHHQQMLEWVTPIYSTLDTASQYQGLREISTYNPGYYDFAEEHQSTLESQINHQLEQLHTLHNQLATTHPSYPKLSAPLNRIEEIWLEQQGEQFSFIRMNDLIGHLNTLLAQLLPERTGYQHLLLRDIPALRETIAQLRGTGSGFLSRSASEQQPDLPLQYDETDPLLKRIERTLWNTENQFILLRNSLGKDEHRLTERTLSIMTELVGETQELRDLIEWELIDAATVSLSPELFFEESSEPIYLLHLLAMDILADTTSSIQQVVDEQERNSLLTLIAVLFSLILSISVVFYYMRHLFQGVRSAVQQLQTIGRGNFDQAIIPPQNRGEITTLLQSIENTQQQLKASYQAVEAERLFSDNLTASMGDGVYALDESGNLVFINNAAEEILGWSADKILGKNFHDLIHAAQPDGSQISQAECLTMESISKGMSYHSEQEWFLHRHGHFIPVELSAAPLTNHRETNGSVAVFRDISERLELDRQLRDALNDAQQASRSKDEFLASMSHELRTPLTSIIGNCEMLAEQESNSDSKAFIDAIESAGRQQLALVNDILDLSKLESGKFTIEEKPFNPNTLIQQIEQLFSSLTRNTDLHFSIHTVQPFSHLLIGDMQRTTQILVNLISNAFKFTKEGGITLSVSTTQEQLLFEVKDSGIGMPAEVVSRLFQRFEQADSSISRRFGGSGLGLYISHHLAQLMNGTIQVESQEGRGSTFTLSLPYRTAAPIAPPQAEQRATTATAPQTQLTGHVLVAEDTPELQLLVRKILQSIGLTVTTANNGLEALNAAKAQPFDLVLMDMQMPEMDGIEATRKIREFNRELPIIALTANVLQKHQDAFNEAGINGFLSKPINRQELAEQLSHYLRKP